MLDRCVRGLEIILQHLILTEGGPGHPLTRVTGLGMGGDVDCRGHFGHGADIGGCSHAEVTPQRCTGGVVTPL